MSSPPICKEKNINKVGGVIIKILFNSDEFMSVMVQDIQIQSNKVVSEPVEISEEQVAMEERDNDVDTAMDSGSKSKSVKPKESSDFS